MRLSPTTVVMAIVLASTPALAGAPQASKRPNIIFIMSDDHAEQAISAYGSELVQTPSIDRIAREGVLFRTPL